MKQLSIDKRVTILSMLVEGASIRSISRSADCAVNSVVKLLVDAGKACSIYEAVHARRIRCARVELDEIWSFLHAKEKNVPQAQAAPSQAGSIWTWTALDPDTKLMIAWEVGGRNLTTAKRFMGKLKGKIILPRKPKVQITSDAFGAYPEAVHSTFGNRVNYTQLVKSYGYDDGAGYSNSTVTETEKVIVIGDSEEGGTSYVERMNLTMRMGMRRYTRKTNGFSKKLENHRYMLHLFFTYYNWVRPHMTLETTPAVAAGLTKEEKSLEWIVGLIDKRTPKPKRPKKYKKRERDYNDEDLVFS